MHFFPCSISLTYWGVMFSRSARVSRLIFAAVRRAYTRAPTSFIICLFSKSSMVSSLMV